MPIMLPRQVKNRTIPQSETLDFLLSDEVLNNQRRKLFHEEELFIKTSEQIFAEKGNRFSELDEETGYTLHSCKQAGDPFVVSTERTLNVHVDHTQGELAKVCLGHNKDVVVNKIGDFQESVKHLKKKYKSDPAIQSFKIICTHTHPSPSHYLARISYRHIVNFDGCDKCKTERVKEDAYKEVGEEWLYDNKKLWDLAKSAESTIIEHVCIDRSPTKEINGKQVSRQCWKEKLSFLYQVPATNDCHFLKQKNCEQIKQECLQYSSSICTQWQLTFRCFEKITRKFVSLDQEQELYQEKIDYAPNQSFSEVAAKLAVFEQVKKEMEQSQLLDITKMQIFQGKRMSCSKNVADHLMYDCCFSYSGLAKQMGLSKCNADEIGLAEMREQGLCHYVGSYEEKMVGLWKSRDEHVFCCFPSKLSRIVQEEGRKQLNLDWGKPKSPDCRGFSTSELSALNFSKMDLSEMCEDIVKKLPEDMPERLKAFQNRLQDEVGQTEAKR